MSSQLLDRPPVQSRRVATFHLPYILMLSSSLAFAAMTACGRALHGRCDWRVTAVFRAGLAFAFAYGIARAQKTPLVLWRPRTLWMRSVVGSVSMLLTFYAMDRLPVGTLLTLTNTFPLWVTLLAWPVLGERPSTAIALALLSGIVGVVLIEHPEQGPIRTETLAALAAAFCTAVVMLGLHRLRRVDSLAIDVHFSGVATGVCIGFALWTAARGTGIDLTTLADPTTAALILGVGGFATVGQIAMTRAFSLGSPQRLAVVGLAQVVFALALDYAIWNVVPDARAAAGTVFIMAPVAWLLARRRA